MAARRTTETVDAIVVGRLDQGEDDRIYYLLTAERGRVSAWGNRARRAKSPFVGLDLGVRARVGLRSGSSDLYTLVGAEVLESRIGLRARLERLGPAAIACEVAGALATTVPDTRLFGCLETALLLLDQHPEDPSDGFLAALLAKLLTFGGLAPALERCPACGEAPALPMAWVPQGGGAFHVDHVPPDVAGSPRIPLEDLAQLAQLRRLPLLQAYGERAAVAPMLALVEAHLGQGLRARVWLQG